MFEMGFRICIRKEKRFTRAGRSIVVGKRDTEHKIYIYFFCQGMTLKENKIV